jgi:hypothetical protein
MAQKRHSSQMERGLIRPVGVQRSEGRSARTMLTAVKSTDSPEPVTRAPQQTMSCRMAPFDDSTEDTTPIFASSVFRLQTWTVGSRLV